MKIKKFLVTALTTLLIILSVYAVLYIGRFIKVNHSGWSETIKASKLPKEILSCVELMGDPPESIEVSVIYRDIDGDGIAELIVDSGPFVRGSANTWYAIWKKQQPFGGYRDLGIFCADGYLFIPGLRIFGNPGILCNHGRIEWVPWKDGRYSCQGPM